MMQVHAVYWRGLAAQGVAIAVGPVLDPKGAWGVAILDIDNREAAQGVLAHDPAIESGLGFSWVIHPMPNVIVGAHATTF